MEGTCVRLNLDQASDAGLSTARAAATLARMADSRLLLEACRILDANGWHYQRVPDREVLHAGFEVHHGRVELVVQCFPELGAVSVVAEGATTLQPTHRNALAELVARANLQLTIGNFEFDWDALRVFFRVTNVFPGERPDGRVLSGMVHAAVAEMDRFIAMAGELAKCPEDALARFDVGRLLRREDLLPPVDGEARVVRPLYE